MAEFMVTPQGITQFARWYCATCITVGGQGLPGEEAREQAAAHVRQTGHVTGIERGTHELLAGFATEAPRRELMPSA